ncbi:MAG: hypothetical protein QOI29_224 [Mycobacterium sp.]|nr:hypothetical protein [Mycobacterium sp.]
MKASADQGREVPSIYAHLLGGVLMDNVHISTTYRPCVARCRALKLPMMSSLSIHAKHGSGSSA